MDGNSCEGETSEKEDKHEEGESKTGKSSEDVTEFAFGGTRLARPEQQDRQAGTSSGVVSDRVGSSIDGSGPSFGFPLPRTEENVPDMSTGSGKQVSVCPNPDSVQCQVVVRDTPVQSEPRRDSIGPPPSYSFVMNEKRKGRVMTETEDIIERPPPPSYAGLRGLYQPPSPLPSENEDNRLCLLPSFAEPIWRSHSQPAFCSRCGILILTTTHAHESVATHVAALALCLFGCWPCCFLPYCMNVCKNTYHYCPVCQGYLGSYTPW